METMLESKRRITSTSDDADAVVLGATCYAHFSLVDASSGETVRDTRADMEPVQFVVSARVGLRDDVGRSRSAGVGIEGLDACARTMRVGERATFEIPPELAYGEEGNFSFPAVGKNKTLTLDLEILGCLGSVEAPETLQRDMTYETRIERVKMHRANGNEAFVAGDVKRAIREYSMALTYLTEDFMMQLFDKYEVEAREEYVAVHGNLAAAFLRLNEYELVSTHVEYVLRNDENNIKAYYRRGKARLAIGHEDAAREDLLKAKRLTDAAGIKDANITTALRELEQTVRDRERETSAVFRGMFGDSSKVDTSNVAPSGSEPATLESHAPSGGFVSSLITKLMGSRR
ncbi:Peptidyl-prolyl cis-trans isomerase,FKBP-type,domain [Ostreococcus tauri]|uniref:peptidylprolyl isomerase n=1 Tax=Ostreococcus tauri TaxID=70448 RepID=A0A096PBG0_OSTTA|nr:Peptidyl-prolyl cis-trans isomerase,FKBP-type,domain [Ostreococcus tauri]CEG02007.1 Peptidyl-prolyl cis-trans isomerase,FKBP-type,domain [Ostreococcus tauri]|eukprot:XP_022841302.1 Peptidyl-prolyl cis-trans isomerase,FKBP-type,domain [Ostreococcus tauri]